MIYTIYKITNKVNQKVYIGFTQNMEIRWKGHIHDSMRKSLKSGKLYRSMNKHGHNNFEIEALYQSKDKHHCKETMEPYFIELYKSIKEGYNIAKGGSGGATRIGMTWSLEQRKMISEKTKHGMNNDVRKKISESKTGKRASAETKRVLSESHKTLRWISNLSTKESMFVHEPEAKKLIESGWIPGRKFNNSWVDSGTNNRHKRKLTLSS